MDGYALRTEAGRNAYEVIGESAAGRGFAGSVNAGQAVRIFTGAPVPEGADTVVMQENVTLRADGGIVLSEPVVPENMCANAAWIFQKAKLFCPPAACLIPPPCRSRRLRRIRSLSRRPQPARMSSSQQATSWSRRERCRDRTRSSPPTALEPLLWQGNTALRSPILALLPTRKPLIQAAIERAMAEGADIIVTLGGASVGDHDLIRPVLSRSGVALDFWQIAMRPGKPLMFGKSGGTFILGLPGNPVSSLVCGQLFLAPLIARFARTELHTGHQGREAGCADARK